MYNLTLKLTNTTYDDNLATAHSSQFNKLRMDFEVGVSFFNLDYEKVFLSTEKPTLLVHNSTILH